MGKEKTRAKASSSKAHKRKESLVVDSETQEQDESLLAGCKSYLSSIFVHWKPCFPTSEPQPAGPTDKLDPGCLAGDVAHLLTRWSLRCLVEDSYDESRTKEFLRWVESAVMKHRETAAAASIDPVLKADFLRLHHLTFEAGCHSSISARAESLQLFANIMMQLLESQEHLPELHQAVVSACLPDGVHEESGRGKNLPPSSQSIDECLCA